MKILGLTPRNPFTGETPEQMYLRKLRDLGHEVITTERTNKIDMDVDVVVAMSEVTCKNAFHLAKASGKPFYAHMEWIPYWRIFYEPESKWGYENRPIAYYQKMQFVRMYQDYGFYWSMANVKSLAANCFHRSVKEFLGAPLKIETKYLGVDVEKIKEYLKNNEPQEKTNEITCVARFVPHKRIHHVIHALNKIKYSGTLNLVGYGPEKSVYDSIPTSFRINYMESSEKFQAMQKAKLTIALWSGMVPAESMYLGTPVLSYHSEYMKELYGSSITYATNNDIINLATKIQEALKRHEDEDKYICKKGIKMIEESMINTLTQKDAIKLLETLIKKV